MPARTLTFPIVGWSLFAALFAVNYLPSIRWMVDRWNETESYSSHGWLIPAVSAWLLWSERAVILPARGAGAASGLWLMGGSLLLHLIAGLADVSSVSGMTMIPMIMGFAAVLHGWAFLRAAWFPIFFLIFMVPPPDFVISTLNFTLKLMAADTAEWLLNLTGVPAIRQGSFMYFGEEKLAIGDVCSGLRSLLALMALSVLYAWLIREKGKAHVIAVLLTALPSAIVGNGIRICLVSYLVIWIGKEKVFTPIVGSWDLHLFTGSFIFLGAMGCLWAVTSLIDAVQAAARGRGRKA